MHWFWRAYALELSPCLITSHVVPEVWRLANILPLLKESPLSSVDQLRLISVTDITIRIVERITYRKEIKPVHKPFICPDQLAYKEGSNTTLALLKKTAYVAKMTWGWTLSGYSHLIFLKHLTQ